MPTTFCQHHPGDVLVFTVGLFLKGAFGNQFCNNSPDKVKYEQYAGMQKRRKKKQMHINSLLQSKTDSAGSQTQDHDRSTFSC